jgi:spore germination cell wall hydrolase CwlJ-like protein
MSMTLWDRLLEFWYSLDLAPLGRVAVPLVLGVALFGAATYGVVQVARSGHQELQAARARAIELHCLATNVYHEARGEPLAGQYAVAEVTMNRVRSRRFPDTVCDVVHERRMDPSRRRYVGAFSWTELALQRPYGGAWETAGEVATNVYDGLHEPQVPGALFYHARRIKPVWAKQKQPLASIGDHVFYP